MNSAFTKTFKFPEKFKESIKRNIGSGKFTEIAALCINGYFLADTPVWIASKNEKINNKYLPIVAFSKMAIPIQSASIFDNAVCHKSVNSSYGLLASNSIDNKVSFDPYTSDQ